MRSCPKCCSARIFRLRIDSDWFYGAGDYYAVNSKECYPEKEYEYDATERPDVDLCHCRACGYMWE